MMYPLVLDLAADGIPVTVTCRVLGFSTQAFYKWRKAPLSQRDWDDAHLINAARDIHADDPAFGYRFIADELPGRGITAGENRVARLCSQERIWSIFAKKRGLNRRSGPPVHDDLVQRQFGAPAANQVWLADITEHRTDEGKLYLCAIKDVHSNRIVGYSIDSRMKSSLAVARPGSRRGASRTCRDDRSFRQGQPISVTKIRPRTVAQRVTRIDGPGRCVRRQRRHGVVLRPSATQRARPATLVHPSRTTPGDRDLDRADLPPTPPATRTRQAHPDRVRTAPHTSRNRGLKITPRESTELGAVPPKVPARQADPRSPHLAQRRAHARRSRHRPVNRGAHTVCGVTHAAAAYRKSKVMVRILRR